MEKMSTISGPSAVAVAIRMRIRAWSRHIRTADGAGVNRDTVEAFVLSASSSWQEFDRLWATVKHVGRPIKHPNISESWTIEIGVTFHGDEAELTWLSYEGCYRTKDEAIAGAVQMVLKGQLDRVAPE